MPQFQTSWVGSPLRCLSRHPNENHIEDGGHVGWHHGWCHKGTVSHGDGGMSGSYRCGWIRKRLPLTGFEVVKASHSKTICWASPGCIKDSWMTAVIGTEFRPMAEVGNIWSCMAVGRREEGSSSWHGFNRIHDSRGRPRSNWIDRNYTQQRNKAIGFISYIMQTLLW